MQLYQQILAFLTLALCASASIHGVNAAAVNKRDMYAPPATTATSGGAAPHHSASSTMASVTAAKPNMTVSEPTDYPTLPPIMDDAMISSMSALDKSLNSEISSIMSEASATLPCLTVTDVSGTPVKMCGPTQASAPPSQNKNAAGRLGDGKLLEGVVVAAALGGLLMNF